MAAICHAPDPPPPSSTVLARSFYIIVGVLIPARAGHIAPLIVWKPDKTGYDRHKPAFRAFTDAAVTVTDGDEAAAAVTDEDGAVTEDGGGGGDCDDDDDTNIVAADTDEEEEDDDDDLDVDD